MNATWISPGSCRVDVHDAMFNCSFIPESNDSRILYSRTLAYVSFNTLTSAPTMDLAGGKPSSTGSSRTGGAVDLQPDICPVPAITPQNVQPGSSSSVVSSEHCARAQSDVSTMYAEVVKPPRNRPVATCPPVVPDVYSEVIPRSQRCRSLISETSNRTIYDGEQVELDDQGPMYFVNVTYDTVDRFPNATYANFGSR
jgi:hypothetical protein